MKSFFSSLRKLLPKRKGEGTSSTPVTPEVLDKNRKDTANLDQKLTGRLKGKKIPSFSQIQHVGKYFSPRERTLARLSFSIFIIASLTLIGRWYLASTVQVAKPGGEYVEGLVGKPQFVNPILAFSDTDLDISKLIFAGLLRYGDNRALVADLAERYEISEDQKIYTFHLRQGLTWQDSEALNADDVIFTFHTIQDPEYKSPLRANFQNVVVEKVDDLTVKFTLAEPLAPFLESLTAGILPEHLWRDIQPIQFALTDLNIKPIRSGSGPFQFKSLTKDRNGDVKSYMLTRSASYHGQKPFIEKITFKFFPDLVSAFESAKSGGIEGISFVPRDSKDELSKFNKKLTYYPLRIPQYTAVFFNEKNEVLKNKNVREALAWSIDRDRIITEALHGEGEIIHGPILPGYVGYNPELKKFHLDAAKASELLDKAGWKKVEGSPYRKNGDKELGFALTTVQLPENEKTVQILKENWAAAGFNIEIRMVDNTTVKKEVIKKRSYDALLFGEIVGNDPDPYPFWHSSQTSDPGLNLAISYNKTVDQLLEEARKTNDAEQRRIKYLHFQNILIEEELPAIFLYNPSYIYGVSKKIKGITSTYISVPSDRFSQITTWYTKTKREWK